MWHPGTSTFDAFIPALHSSSPDAALLYATSSASTVRAASSAGGGQQLLLDIAGMVLLPAQNSVPPRGLTDAQIPRDMSNRLTRTHDQMHRLSLEISTVRTAIHSHIELPSAAPKPRSQVSVKRGEPHLIDSLRCRPNRIRSRSLTLRRPSRGLQESGFTARACCPRSTKSIPE